MLLRTYDAGNIVLQDLASGQCRTISDAALLLAIHEGHVQCEEQARSKAELALGPEKLALLEARGVTSAAIQHAVALMQWLTACRARGIVQFVNAPWVRSELKRIGSTELVGVRKFAMSTLYDADLTLRKSDGDVCQLVPNYAGRGGRGHLRIDPRSADLLQAELARRLAGPPKPLRTRDVWQSLNVAIDAVNANTNPPLAPVSESTVRRVIEREVPARVRHELRLGKKSARKAFRSNSAARDRATRPLEIAEYDDVDACVFLVDERNGLPWGRSWITNGIDDNTALVLGSHLGDKPRNYYSAIGAIIDSLVPKSWCESGEMGYGAQGIMLVDNASYNVGTAMKHRSEAERLLISRARPYGPTEKCCIEHFNSRVKQEFCPTLPGWAGPKNDREALKEGMASAVLTLGSFTKLYRHWLTKVYANSPGEDGFTAKQRWLSFYDKHSPAIRFSAEQLALLRLRPVTVKFKASGGIAPLGLRYDSPELAKLRDQLGKRAPVVVFVDPQRLTSVKVLNPLTSTFLHVPSTEDHRYIASITASQHRMVLALQRSRGKKNPSLKDLVEGREMLAQMVSEARDSHKYLMRKRARMVDPFDDAPPVDAAPQATQEEYVVVTELENQVTELQLIEIDREEW